MKFKLISDRDWLIMRTAAVGVFALSLVALGWLWLPVFVGWFRFAMDWAFESVLQWLGVL